MAVNLYIEEVDSQWRRVLSTELPETTRMHGMMQRRSQMEANADNFGARFLDVYFAQSMGEEVEDDDPAGWASWSQSNPNQLHPAVMVIS